MLNIDNTFDYVVTPATNETEAETQEVISFENVRVKGVFRTNIKLKEDGFIAVTFLNTSQNIKLYKNGRLFSDLDVSEFKEIYVRSNDVIHYEVVDNVTNDFNLEFFYRKTSNRVNFKNYFSKIKQKDFVKSVMQDFGLIHRKNKDNVYEFITINDLFFKNNNVVDWSNIFDAKKSLSSKTPTYGQENILSYQYEDDDNFADGSFFIENETLRDEVGVFRSIMRASKITQRFANQSLYGINFWQPETDENAATTYKANGKKPYSFLVQESGINASYKVGSENNVAISTIPLASFQSISYNNVAPKYYSIYSNVLNRFRLYNVTMRLSAIDVYNLDFFALHYIDILGEYFYINKVKGFKNNKVTQVELISVNTLDVKGEFNNDFNNDFDI